MLMRRREAGGGVGGTGARPEGAGEGGGIGERGGGVTGEGVAGAAADSSSGQPGTKQQHRGLSADFLQW